MANNLLTLLNQLQEMERSVTNFMLETVLKMQRLTDTKVLLLLESPERRRYCGSKELVDYFERCNYKSINKDSGILDIEVELAPDVNLLVEKRKKRKAPKRSIEEDFEALVEGDFECVSPPKRSHLSNLSHNIVGTDDDDDDDDQPTNAIAVIKKEECYIDSDEEDYAVADEQGSLNYLTGLMEESSDGDGTAEPSLHSNVPSAQKVKALESIKDPEAAFEKGTWENKLLGSILYEYGKDLAEKCPYDDVSLHLAEVRSYLNKNMDQYLAYFQRFTVVERKNFPDTLKSQSPNSYMRNIVRSGFKRATTKYQTKRPKKQVSKEDELKKQLSKVIKD